MHLKKITLLGIFLIVISLDGEMISAQKTSLKRLFKRGPDQRTDSGHGWSWTSRRSSQSDSDSARVGRALTMTMNKTEDLVRELQSSINILAEKETLIIQEMNEVKSTLNRALKLLQESGKDTFHRIKRRSEVELVLDQAAKAFGDQDREKGRSRRNHRGFQGTGPYRACVFIDPELASSDASDMTIDIETKNADVKSTSNMKIKNADMKSITLSVTTPKPIVVNVAPKQEQEQRNPEKPLNSYFDLSSAYFVKMPDSPAEMEAMYGKVDNVVDKIWNSNRDMVVIPVEHGMVGPPPNQDKK